MPFQHKNWWKINQNVSHWTLKLRSASLLSANLVIEMLNCNKRKLTDLLAINSSYKWVYISYSIMTDDLWNSQFHHIQSYTEYKVWGILYLLFTFLPIQKSILSFQWKYICFEVGLPRTQKIGLKHVWMLLCIPRASPGMISKPGLKVNTNHLPFKHFDKRTMKISSQGVEAE